MKKILICALTIQIMWVSAGAQVSLQPALPTSGLVQKNQLWNILLINNAGASYSAKIDLILTDRNTGQEILTAGTGQFTLPAGAKQLNADAVMPIQYNSVNGSFDTRFQGLLPVGNYTACYSLSGIGNKEVLLAEECLSFDVEPLSPPMLVYPEDSALLEPTVSQFSWIPPTPSGIFSNLHYEILITPLNEGQSAQDAIQENLPFYNQDNELGTSLVYPASAPAFEKDKWYAWQVVAKDDKNYAGKSEVWVFKVLANKKTEPSVNNSYILLDAPEASGGVYYLKERILQIKYYSYEKEQIAAIVLYTFDGKMVRQLKQPLKYGDNFFSVKLDGAFSAGQTYTLVLTDNKGKMHKALFYIND